MSLFKRSTGRERLSVTYLVLATYILLLAARFIDAALLNRDNEFFLVILLELVIFALPVSLWIWLRRGCTAASLRFTLPKTSLLLILSATLALISGGLLLAIAVGGIDSISGSFKLYDTFTSKNSGGVGSVIYLTVAYAALPALCEETLFRSLLCVEYEKGGALCAVVLSSVLFGMLHFDLRLLPVYIFSGVLLALTMYASRSVIASVIVHFLYNIFGLFCQPYVTAFYRTTGSAALFVIILAVLFLLSAAVFCSQAGRLYRHAAEANAEPPYPVSLSPGLQLESLYSAVVSLPFLLCPVVFVIAVILF